MCQHPASNTGMVAWFKLNGDLNDSSANANNLTGSGGAIATTVDSPYKATEYGIITKVNYAASNTTVTLFTGTDHTIPNGTMTNPFSSNQAVPYGFPASRGKWTVSTFIRISATSSTPAGDTWYMPNAGYALSIPTGDFIIEYVATYRASATGAPWVVGRTTMSTVTNAETIPELTTYQSKDDATSGAITLNTEFNRNHPVSLTSATWFYLLGLSIAGGSIGASNGFQPNVVLKAECAYI